MNISKLIVSFIVSTSLFTEVLSAQMVSTEASFEHAKSVSSKEKLHQIISREDVKKEFEQMGVDSKVIQARVASMTDSEASQIAYKIDTLPAGGDAGASLVGAIVFIFIVLLITDIIGVTKVFNFTKPITNR
jgi:hypothetical protein